MNSSTSLQALAVAVKVYQEFQTEVLENYVLKDRIARLSDKTAKAVKEGRQVDTRRLRLAGISGKGGVGYGRCLNITLLDHLLSVVRGALVLAALDSAAADPNIDLNRLEQVLRVVAAVAFLHDVDKDLELPRDTPLDPAQVWERWQRYGLDRFTADWSLSADQVVALIERVEATQAHRTQPAKPLPQILTRFIDYIGLADKLDGKWCCEGAEAVVKHLRETAALRHPWLRNWQVIRVYAPHYPFLLDEFLRWLSVYCQRHAGVPPLLELHHDGQLLVMLPENLAKTIQDQALQALIGNLRRHLCQWRLSISNRNVPEIVEGRPDHDELREFFQERIDDVTLKKLFVIQKGLKESLMAPLDDLLMPLGLAPRWPSKVTGQSLPLYAAVSEIEGSAREYLGRAAHLAALLKHKETKGLPSSEAREAALREILGDPPSWIAEVPERISRHTLLSLWAVTRALQSSEILEEIWGDSGCLQNWLQGLQSSLHDPGDALLAAVEQRLNALMQQTQIPGEAHGKHCLITALPIDSSAQPIETKDNLYEIKVSAFSGRDGRKESLDDPKGETFLEPVSYVEYRLRRLEQERLSLRGQGFPVLLSAPATTGLFAALTLNHERDFKHLSVYDLARQDVKKGAIYHGLEIYRGRYRIARFETWPQKLAEQVDLLRLLLQASLRLGRPLHLFRGLPTPQKAFFYADTLPQRLENLIGGASLRLEQIPPAIERLQRAFTLLNTQGLGLEVFNLYACPDTRLGAVALAACHLRNQDDPKQRADYQNFQNDFLQLVEENAMTEAACDLVQLGRLAATIQRRPYGIASNREEMLCFNLALEAAIDAWRLGCRDREALIHAVAGELETNLARKELYAAAVHRQGQTLRQGCMDWAERFVDAVWLRTLHGAPPSQRNRRILGAIYRMAFVTAPVAKDATATETDS